MPSLEAVRCAAQEMLPVVVRDQFVRDDAAALEARLAPWTRGGHGCGVLLRAATSAACDRHMQVERAPANRSRLMSKIHWSLRELKDAAREKVSGIATVTGPPFGWAKDRFGLGRSDVYVDAAANGGIVRNVNEFIWLGL